MFLYEKKKAVHGVDFLGIAPWSTKIHFDRVKVSETKILAGMRSTLVVARFLGTGVTRSRKVFVNAVCLQWCSQVLWIQS